MRVWLPAQHSSSHGHCQREREQNLCVWLSAWEHKAETPKSSNIMRPYLQVQPAEFAMESRERRPACVCVCVMWKTNEHCNVGY